MAYQYSEEFKQNVLETYQKEEGKTRQAEFVQRFGISKATLYNWRQEQKIAQRQEQSKIHCLELLPISQPKQEPIKTSILLKNGIQIKTQLTGLEQFTALLQGLQS